MMRTPIFLFVMAYAVLGAGPNTIVSRRVESDFWLSLDAAAKPWRRAAPMFIENDPNGAAVAGHRTEVRSLWSTKHLYFLYACPYETLNLHPNPSTNTETMSLWEWDVVELFVSAEKEYLRHYKELQVSPQGEWLDLDINRDVKDPAPWKWNSGFQVSARVDAEKKMWYGAMRIPWTAIDYRRAKQGNELHLSICRIQGAKPDRDRKKLVWGGSFHRPEGTLILTK